MKLIFDASRPLEVQNNIKGNKDSVKADKFNLDCRIKELVNNEPNNKAFTFTCGCFSTTQVFSCGC